MDTLFKSIEQAVLPPINGLRYVPDFLTQEEHDALIATIDASPWELYSQRRIQPYGGRYAGTGEPAPLPPWGKAIAQKLFQEGLTPFVCDQILVNEYLPGQGIGSHVDYGPYDRAIVSISLNAGCVMDLTRPDKSERHGIWLEPRSALILDGEARYAWQHGIARRLRDKWNGEWIARERRVSVTLRKHGTTNRLN